MKQKLIKLIIILLAIIMLWQDAPYAYQETIHYLRPIALDEAKRQLNGSSPDELINNLTTNDEKKAFKKLGEDPNLKAAYEAALYLLKGGTAGVGRVVKKAINTNGGYVEEFLGELVEARAVETNIKYAKVIELNVVIKLGAKQFPEMDFVLEVNRGKYHDRSSPIYELPDGFYLGESKTFDRGGYILDIVTEATMDEKLPKYRLNTVRMRKNKYDIKGIIFVIGGEIITSGGIRDFRLEKQEPEEADRLLGLAIFLAFVPDEVMKKPKREKDIMAEVEGKYVEEQILELKKDGKIEERNVARFKDILTTIVSLKGETLTRFIILDAKKRAGCPSSRKNQTVQHWVKVFEILQAKADTLMKESSLINDIAKSSEATLSSI